MLTKGSQLGILPHETGRRRRGCADFGPATVFVPQKLRALRRCVWLLLAAASAAGAYFVLSLMG